MRLFLITLIFVTTASAAGGPALPGAHAHNDYEHDRPLLDALSYGFTSVEADVYLVDGQLLVAHDREDLKPDRTLASLYLDPLKRLSNGKRSIFPTGETLTLLIDFKTEAEPTYATLRAMLGSYRDMLTSFEGDSIKTNAVTIIISGNRPREILASEISRLAAYDGRLADLGKKNLPVGFMPLVSDNWNNHFTWKGVGEFPADQRAKLRSILQQTHAEHRKLRFWATPDSEAAWRILHEAGVDLINTDKLPELAAFLRSVKK
jgi:hypothetical protein